MSGAQRWSALIVGDSGGLLAEAGHDWTLHPEHYERVDLVRADYCRRQQERVAELEDKIRADHAKKVRVQAFAELRLCVAENPEQPFTKKQLRKALQHTIDALRQIAMDEVPQEIWNG